MAMTLGELKSLLDKYPDDTPVEVVNDSGGSYPCDGIYDYEWKDQTIVVISN